MWHRAVWLSCDGEGCASDTHEHRAHTVAEARRVAGSRLHWTFSNGLDLCPICGGTLLAAVRAQMSMGVTFSGAPAGWPADPCEWDLLNPDAVWHLMTIAGWNPA